MKLKKFENLILPYKHIIYDFDGTIAYLTINWSQIKEELRNKFEKPFSSLWQVIDEMEDDEQQEALRIISILELEAIETKGYRVNPIAMDSIKVCINKNKKISIFSTNSRNTIEKVLDDLNLENVFSYIVAAESVKKHKPHPEGILLILRKFSLDSSDILFIGNTRNDKISGEAFSVKTVMIEALESMEI